MTIKQKQKPHSQRTSMVPWVLQQQVDLVIHQEAIKVPIGLSILHMHGSIIGSMQEVEGSHSGVHDPNQEIHHPIKFILQVLNSFC